MHILKGPFVESAVNRAVCNTKAELFHAEISLDVICTACVSVCECVETHLACSLMELGGEMTTAEWFCKGICSAISVPRHKHFIIPGCFFLMFSLGSSPSCAHLHTCFRFALDLPDCTPKTHWAGLSENRLSLVWG